MLQTYEIHIKDCHGKGNDGASGKTRDQPFSMHTKL